EHHLRPVPDGPPYRLGIPPTFMTDDDTERQRADSEYAPIPPGRIDGVFRRVELHLVLATGDRPVSIDHERRRNRRAIYDTLRTQYDCDVRGMRRHPDTH